jgi:type II secretory pathway component PulF
MGSWNGYISVVPQFDLTAYHATQELNTWKWNEQSIVGFYLELWILHLAFFIFITLFSLYMSRIQIEISGFTW